MKNTPVIFLPQALKDLDDIWIWIFTESTCSDTADKVVDEIEDTCLANLSLFPEYGRPRDDLREGLRGFPIGSYIILYQYNDEQVVIEHIIHGSQEYQSFF